MYTLTCDPYNLALFNYNMYDAETDGKQDCKVGNHTLIPIQDGGAVTLCSIRRMIH